MDSWSSNSVVKGFASDQSLSNTFVFGKPQLCSLLNELTFENQIFGDNNFPPSMNNSASQNAFSEDHGPKSRQSGLVNRKLGRIMDQKGAQISQNLSSKRSKQNSIRSSTPFCKVYGCKKNLSSCKDYYKRHKVCEVHSKTSKVIVNGVEQRFCQQCSRFHMLGEFDDGKRSCRKRLAGHNERRRKPHMGQRYGRSYDVSVQGDEHRESTEAISSFPNPNDLHSPYQESKVKWDVNPEDRTPHDIQSTSGITDDQQHSASVSPCNFETNAINECFRASVSSSASARSLLSSQSGSTSSRIQTSDSPVFLGSHDLVGFQDNLVRFGVMYYDDQVVGDQSCMIDVFRLSSQLNRVQHQKRESQVNSAN